MRRHKQTSSASLGFGAIEIVLVIVFLVAAGVLGGQIYRTRQGFNTNTGETGDLTDQIPTAPLISDADDLETATKTLDSVNYDLAGAEAEQLSNDAQIQN